jgi:uncharacterized RDD family membrane protein YckC
VENSTYALVLTGDVLPGYAPESVWPALATYFRMEPAKLTGQLLARAPLAIKQSDDLGKLQTLQAGVAAVGAEADLCAPDGRANLFVVLDNAPRGPMPRVFVDERVQHGLWPDTLMVVAVGSNTWAPYRDFDADAVAATTSPRPVPVIDEPWDADAGVKQTAPLALAPLTDTDAGDGHAAALPPGAAIHAGFWRRCAAYLMDTIVLAVVVWTVNAVSTRGFAISDGTSALDMTFLVTYGLEIAITWLYFALQESSVAQATLGKRAMGIKVTDDYGQRIGFGRATGRFFGKILSGVIFDIGFMLAGWTARKQALHDMLAGTVVVFRTVKPGLSLPDVRPPMPWYGWLVNILVPCAMLAGAVALWTLLWAMFTN